MTSSPTKYLHPHNPPHRVVLTRWSPLQGSMSLGVSAPPIHSSRSAYAQLESHSKEDCFPRSSRPIRQACGAVSYGMVCHSCGFWLVTKPEPDSFLGLFTVLEKSALDWNNSAPLYCDLVCANFPGRLENGEVPRKNPERRLKQ